MDQRPVKHKENQDADSITDAVVLKADGANQIRDLYRGICEIPENERN